MCKEDNNTQRSKVTNQRLNKHPFNEGYIRFCPTYEHKFHSLHNRFFFVKYAGLSPLQITINTTTSHTKYINQMNNLNQIY